MEKLIDGDINEKFNQDFKLHNDLSLTKNSGLITIV